MKFNRNQISNIQQNLKKCEMSSDGDMPQIPPTRIYKMLLHTVADHSSMQNILEGEGVSRKTLSVTHENVLQTLRLRNFSPVHI